MDENSLNGAQNVGVANRTNLAANDKIDDANGNAQNNVPQYTIPGILHFIEHEWQRFQAERSQWDTDRAELQVSQSPKVGQTVDLEKFQSLQTRKNIEKEKFNFSRFSVVNISLSYSPFLSRTFISCLCLF